MIDFQKFLEFIKTNDVAGIANPLSDSDEISIQDLKILYEEYVAKEKKD